MNSTTGRFTGAASVAYRHCGKTPARPTAGGARPPHATSASPRDRYAPRWLFAALAISGGAPLYAGDISPTEDDFFAAMPRVLSAARLVQPLVEAPAAVTVIDREMIEASSAIDIAQLLGLVPGFQVTYVEGVEAISTYHGVADSYPRRMQVLVDGRSVYDAGLNGVIWSALPLTLDQIERVEVVRGPNAPAYGSNAFLGTINIVTRRPALAERLAVRVMAGSADTRQAEVAHAAQLERFAYRINASYDESDGYPGKSDHNRSRIVNFQGAYHPAQEQSLTFSTGLRETPFDSESFRIPRQREYRSHFQQLTWDYVRSADEDVRIQAYHNAFETPDNFNFLVGGVVPINVDYSLKTHRYDIEVQHRFSPRDDWRVSWGGGLRWDRVRGAGIFDSADTIKRDYRRLFGNTEWQPRNDLTVNLGAIAEDFSDVGSFFSPRIGLNWHPGKRQTLRLSAARAYRMPTLLETRGELKVDLLATAVSPDFVELYGTRSNDAERLDAVELAYLFDVPAIRGSFDLRLFHNEITPLLDDASDISLPPNPTFPTRFLEAGSLRISGFEAQARLRPFDGSLVHLAYAYARLDGSRIVVTDGNDNAVPIAGRDNPESNQDLAPEHTFSALLAHRLPGDWLISGTFSYVSAMTWMGEGDEVDGRSRVDAKLVKRFRQSDGEIELSLNIHNLLDDPYWEFTSPNPAVGVSGNLSDRQVYAQVKFVYW